MSYDQVKWAKQHDWFVEAHYTDGFWAVTVRDGDEYELFANYESLRHWAGY